MKYRICTISMIVACMCLSPTLQAREILLSGNAMNESSHVFATNLDQIDHNFTFIGADELAQTELSRYDVVWLDGFSFFDGLWVGTLMSYVELGGTLLVQSPGFGSNSIESFPFGEELMPEYTEPDFEDQVRIVEEFHPLNIAVTDELLSSWQPTSAYGYFESDIGGFLGITDNTEDGHWVTVVREVGQGLLVYTQQALAQSMGTQGLRASAGQLEFLRALFQRTPRLAALTPPLFMDESNLWLSSDGDLNILFPNPNLDGFDVSGQAQFSYLFTLEKLGDLAYGPEEVTSDVWPVTVTLARDDLPSSPYYLGLVRKTNFVNMTNYVSQTKFVINPTTTGFPYEASSFRRWLLHLPKNSGGFDGLVQLENTNPAEASDVYLVAFDAAGQRLTTLMIPLEAGDRYRTPLYGSPSDGLFDDPALFDLVSHVAIWEKTPKTNVSVKYVSVKSGFGVWVDEVDMEHNIVNGHEFLLEGTAPDSGYWDGAALLNLTSSLDARISVSRFDADGNPAGEMALGTLEPGHKMLALFSDLFQPFEAGASYVISCGEGDAEIQVLGLSGIKTGAFFAPAKISHVR